MTDDTRHPLAGRRIVITRPREQGAALEQLLLGVGAKPLLCPAIRIVPCSDCSELDRALSELPVFRWIVFTSANAVRAVVARLGELGRKPSELGTMQIAAVGRITRDELAANGVHCSTVPEQERGIAIVRVLGDVAGVRILLPRSQIAGEELPQVLRSAGAVVDEVVAYRTLPSPEVECLAEPLQRGEIDAITFSSPSAVAVFGAMLRDNALEDFLNGSAPPVVVALGPVTAAAAERAGWHVHATAERPHSEAVFAALEHCFASDRHALHQRT